MKIRMWGDLIRQDLACLYGSFLYYFILQVEH